MSMIYLDYAATTPLDPTVKAQMLAMLEDTQLFGNPHSPHPYGLKANKIIAIAREQLAALLHCQTQQIVFTSGATEANNLAIKGTAFANAHRGRHLITSQIEHASVLNCYRFLETQGFSVSYLKPDRYGIITPEQVEQAITQDTLLLSLAHVNNELGTIQDIARISHLCRQHQVICHIDAAQSIGKLPIDLMELPINLLSISAHKFYGPKGVGALYHNLQSPFCLQPQVHGGNQEMGLRSGTLAPLTIMAFGLACEIAQTQRQIDQQHTIKLRQQLLSQLHECPHIILHNDHERCLPGIVNFSITEVDPNMMMLLLWQQLAVSAGSACCSQTQQPSYVLTAIGLEKTLAQHAVRLSFGRFTQAAELKQASAYLLKAITQLTKPHDITR